MRIPELYLSCIDIICLDGGAGGEVVMSHLYLLRTTCGRLPSFTGLFLFYPPYIYIYLFIFLHLFTLLLQFCITFVPLFIMVSTFLQSFLHFFLAPPPARARPTSPSPCDQVISVIYVGMLVVWAVEIWRLKPYVLKVHYLCLLCLFIKGAEAALVAAYFHRQVGDV